MLTLTQVEVFESDDNPALLALTLWIDDYAREESVALTYRQAYVLLGQLDSVIGPRVMDALTSATASQSRSTLHTSCVAV